MNGGFINFSPQFADKKAMKTLYWLAESGAPNSEFLQALERLGWNVVSVKDLSQVPKGAMVLSDADAEAEKQRKRNIEQSKTELAIKQREEFLSVCAHDLRSPLGLIQSSLGMLLKQYQGKLDTFQTEIVTRAQRQATQSLSLVHDLLDVMALEQGLRPQYQVVHLHQLLSEFHKDMKFQAEQKGVIFQYENPVQSWRVLIDPERIRQMLQNLLSNAIKFTETGKNIYLRVSPFQGRRKTDPPYPMLIVSLRDEGKGIAQPDLQKIFDRFTQLKTQQRADGRGLGLSVAKQISNLHDGNIWVESEEGKGTTFFALLPHVINQWEIPVPTGTEKRKVLIVEPAVEKRARYHDAFRAWNAEVLFAADGVEALTMLFHVSPRIVILRPHLDKLGEKEIASVLKTNKTTSNLPVFLATDDPGSVSDTAPFAGVLGLPLDLSTIENAINPRKVKRAA